jgi:hypothetical protein
MENNLRREFTSSAPHTNHANRKRVVAPIERDGKTFWLRLGAAFQNKDASWTIYLDAFPFTGKLQLRDWDEPWEGRGRGGQGGGAPALPGGVGTLALPAMSGATENDNTPF